MKAGDKVYAAEMEYDGKGVLVGSARLKSVGAKTVKVEYEMGGADARVFGYCRQLLIDSDRLAPSSIEAVTRLVERLRRTTKAKRDALATAQAEQVKAEVFLSKMEETA